MASKLCFVLSALLLLCGVYADQPEIYVRGTQDGAYVVPGVFDQSTATGEHIYNNGAGVEYRHQNSDRAGAAHDVLQPVGTQAPVYQPANPAPLGYNQQGRMNLVHEKPQSRHTIIVY